MDKEKKAEYNRRWREKQKEKKKVEEEKEEEPQIEITKEYLKVPETKIISPPKRRNKPKPKPKPEPEPEPEPIIEEEELTEEQLEEMINKEVERRLAKSKNKRTLKTKDDDSGFFFTKSTIETMKNQAIQIIMPMMIPLTLRLFLNSSGNSAPLPITRPSPPFRTSAQQPQPISLEEQFLRTQH